MSDAEPLVVRLGADPKWLETYARRHGLDEDPPRCHQCGHPFDDGCGCTCCYDYDDPDDTHEEAITDV